MANTRGKSVDTTYLSTQQAAERGFIHRDYIAHCLRWSHVIKWLSYRKRYQTAHILDVGCGKEAPLAGTIFTSRMTHTTGSYTGVDYGPIEPLVKFGAKFNAQFMPKTDFAKVDYNGSFDLITSFEMLEHVEPLHSYKTLVNMQSVLNDGGTIFLSTPCYSVASGAADNHVNEMSVAGLHHLIRLAGLEVKQGWGTFASQTDYKKLLTPGQQEVWDKLVEYYDSNMLACFMAPMFPYNSRNAIWEVGHPSGANLTQASPKDIAAAHHSSSANWAADIKKAAAHAKKLGNV